jgi:hypothetical protein
MNQPDPAADEITVHSAVVRIVYPLKPWIAWTWRIALVMCPLVGAFWLGWFARG